jgi:hypothetical protein
VYEVRERRVRPLLPDEPGGEIEVVVVEEDRRFGIAVQLIDDRRRELRVDDCVAVVPRGVETAVDGRRVGELPEMVL